MRRSETHAYRTSFAIIARALVTALLVYMVVFVAFAVLPTDPARALLGPVADERAVAALNAKYGLDAPIPERLVLVSRQLLQGDFGNSIVFGEPVAPLVAAALSTSLVRLAAAVPLGFVAALWLVPLIVVHRSTVGRWLLLSAASIPSFALLSLLLMIFGSLLTMAPSEARSLYEALSILIAALVVMATVSLTLLERVDFRVSRSRQADFLLLLQAPPDRLVAILMRGAMPSALAAAANSLAPALTALTFAEIVFGLPGFARLFIRACDNGDLAVVAFGSLVLALILSLAQAVADFISANADRRLR